MILRDVLPLTMHNQVDRLTDEITGRTPVSVRCGCGAGATIAARALVRKWSGRECWLCRSCHVKGYVSSESRIKKFKESFAATAVDPEHRRRCAAQGRGVWADPVTRARITEAVRQDNIHNPKKAESRRIASAALRAKSWFREHMARMRVNQRTAGTSVLELATANVLSSLGLKYEPQFVLGPYAFDFAVGKQLIEVQGEYWHKDRIHIDSAKATYAVTAGYQIHHIWENEFAALGKVRETIGRWFGLQNDELVNFKLGDVQVVVVETLPVRIFLGAYHYLPAISKSGFHIGAYLDGELIATATFSSVVRKETAIRLGGNTTTVRELSRFCVHPCRHKPHFASWFLARAIKTFKRHYPAVEKLVAFADRTAGHTGGIYKAGNWHLDGETTADYVYLTGDGYYAHKKTIWDRASKFKMTEAEYAELHGFVKINSDIKRRFTYDLR